MNAMQALDRCRRAWERTSPQLVIDGWLDMLDEQDGLDETQPSALRLVEPVGGLDEQGGFTAPIAGVVIHANPLFVEPTRLTSGAEPSHAPPEGLTASVPMRGPALTLPPRYPGGGSAPSHNTTEVAADPVRDTRGDLQEGA